MARTRRILLARTSSQSLPLRNPQIAKAVPSSDAGAPVALRASIIGRIESPFSRRILAVAAPATPIAAGTPEAARPSTQGSPFGRRWVAPARLRDTEESAANGALVGRISRGLGAPVRKANPKGRPEIPDALATAWRSFRPNPQRLGDIPPTRARSAAPSAMPVAWQKLIDSRSRRRGKLATS